MVDFAITKKHTAPSPTLAALAIARYTRPGDLVVDLGCGDGRTLVDAIRADRLAIGIERNSRLADEAREAVLRATAQGGPGFAAVVVGELADVPHLVGSDSLQRASLVFADLSRVGVLGVHGRVEAAGIVGRLSDALHTAHRLVRPGGHVVVRAKFRESFCRDFTELVAEVGAESNFEAVEPDAGKTDQCRMRCALARYEEAVILRPGVHGTDS